MIQSDSTWLYHGYSRVLVNFILWKWFVVKYFKCIFLQVCDYMTLILINYPRHFGPRWSPSNCAVHPLTRLRYCSGVESLSTALLGLMSSVSQKTTLFHYPRWVSDYKRREGRYMRSQKCWTEQWLEVISRIILHPHKKKKKLHTSYKCINFVIYIIWYI